MTKKIGYLSNATLTLLAKKAEEQIPSLAKDEELTAEDLMAIVDDLNQLKADRNHKVDQKTYDWIFAELDWMYEYAAAKLEEEAKRV